jgi:hypothetical protein
VGAEFRGERKRLSSLPGARLMSRNRRPAGRSRKKGREHEVGERGRQAGSRGKWETGTERTGRARPSRRRLPLPLPSRFHRPRAPGAPPAAARQLGDPGAPRVSQAGRRGPRAACPLRGGVLEWRRASDRIRLGRPGARRGGDGVSGA